MQYGVTLPNVGVDARILADLAHNAEVAGWDGVFVWDSVHSETSGLKGRPVCDPWVGLTAMAMCTERVRIVPMVSHPSRRGPWKRARERVYLDQLSRGRCVH